MAYAFAAGNSRYLSSAQPTTGFPVTVAAWIKPSSGSQAIASIGVSSATHRNQLLAGIGVPSSAVVVQAQSVGASGTPIAIATAGSDSAGTWIHAAGVFTSATSRTAYANGSGITNTGNCGTQNTANSFMIGARWNTSVGLYFTGDIAEVGVWDVALTADEITSLAKGVACRLIRPQSLVFYAPLVRDLVDLRGGLAITNNNTATVAAHPRVYA